MKRKKSSRHDIYNRITGQIVTKLVQQAKEGDIHAAKEVLLRVLGRPLEPDVLEWIEELQVAVDRLTEREKRW